MIKLEISFNTVKELSKFVQKMEGDVVSAKVSVPSEVVEPNCPALPSSNIEEEVLSPQQKAAKTRAAKKAKKEADAKALAAITPAIDINQTAAAAMHIPAAMAQPAPVAQLVPEPIHAPLSANLVHERGQYIEEAQALIGEMKTLGVADEEVLPKLQEAYARVGIPWARISELADNHLPIIIQELRNFVFSLKNAGIQAAPVAAPSYV